MAAKPKQKLQVGCCGFALAQSTYFRTFSCVEIDSSFYQLPRLETVERWRADTPDGFQFAMKAWQVITHPPASPTYKRTRIEPNDLEHAGHFGFNPTIRWAWDETYKVAKALGVFFVLFQCPASFRQNKENIASLKSFFERAKRGKFQIGWEPRGEWETGQIASLCKELDLIHVVDPLRASPAHPCKLNYYRLHGTTGPQHRFTNAELTKLQGLATGKNSAYYMFNNVTMATDAQRFMKLL